MILTRHSSLKRGLLLVGTLSLIVLYQNCSGGFSAITPLDSKSLSNTTGNDEPELPTPSPTPEPQPPLPPNNAPPTGNPSDIISLKAILDDMQQDGEFATRKGGHAHIAVSNTESLRAVSRPGRPVNFADTVYAMTPWFWIFANPHSKSTNTAVQVRMGACYILRRSTNQWEKLGGGYWRGVEQKLNYDTMLVEWQSGWDQGLGHSYPEDGVVQVKPEWLNTVSPRYIKAYELWIREKGCIADQPFGHDLKAVFATVQARLVLIDKNGVDDRALANFTAQLGYDFWAPKSWHATTMKEDAYGNPIPDNSPEWKPGYPAMHMDGGHGRCKYIRNEWQSFNVISVAPKTSINLNPPFSHFVFDREPFVLSNLEFQLNPPPLN